MRKISRKMGTKFGVVTAVLIVAMMSLSMLSIGSISNTAAIPRTAAGPEAVNIGTAGNYVILAKSGISTTGATAIVGDIAVSPAAATYITGFGLTASADGTYAKSALVIGKVYASDYAVPTPTTLTTAVGDMETAYNDAAGRTGADVSDLNGGDISNMTLAPGLYNWSGSVTIYENSWVELNGSATDIYIFQIAGDLTLRSGAFINLTKGALPKNIFWQVTLSVNLETASHMRGIILCNTNIAMLAGASLSGRAFAKTAVTLIGNIITVPLPDPALLEEDGGGISGIPGYDIMLMIFVVGAVSAVVLLIHRRKTSSKLI